MVEPHSGSSNFCSDVGYITSAHIPLTKTSSWPSMVMGWELYFSPQEGGMQVPDHG